jgi:hypothetical protein
MSPWFIHAVLQVLDGILTYVGVTVAPRGLAMEANPLIKFLMSVMGPGMALLFIKSIALLILNGLQTMGTRLVMLRGVISIVNCFYATTVVLWIYVFVKR